MSDPNRKEYSYSEKPNSSDLIYRQAAIDAAEKESQVDGAYGYMDTKSIVDLLNNLPAAQPERTEYIPETKAVRSKRDCVDLSERVSATFYDQEHEEWTQQTVTIADVLDSVCDEYTILPSAQSERKIGKWKITKLGEVGVFDTCSECRKVVKHKAPFYNYCPNCGADMRGKQNGQRKNDISG